MAKRTISFADYEEPTWEEYSGEDPPAGKWFTAKLNRVKFLEEDDQLMFVFEITDGDYAGWGRAIYAPFEGERKFAMHQTLKALQGGAMKDVTVDWANEKAVAAWVAKQKLVKIKTREYNDKILIAKAAPLLEGVPGAKAPATTPKAAPLAESEADEPEAGDYTEEELAEMETADLEEILVEEFELPKDDEEFPKQSRRDKTGAKYKADLIEAILAEQDGDEGDADAESEGDTEEGDDFEDGFEGDEDADEELEPEPEPAKPARRSRAAKAAPAKAAPATTRRRRS